MNAEHKRAFTLLEMLVVVSVIIILLALALPLVRKWWENSVVANSRQELKNILRIARSRSQLWEYPGYGAFFFVDPDNNVQRAVFVKDFTYPIYHSHEILDLLEIDNNGSYLFDFDNPLRFAPLSVLDWSPEELENEDYRQGKHLNFFVSLFQRGRRATSFGNIMIQDPDINDDGKGDITHLPVDDFEEIPDIVSAESGKPVNLYLAWDIASYNQSLLQEDGMMLNEVVSHPLFVTQYYDIILGEPEILSDTEILP